MSSFPSPWEKGPCPRLLSSLVHSSGICRGPQGRWGHMEGLSPQRWRCRLIHCGQREWIGGHRLGFSDPHEPLWSRGDCNEGAPGSAGDPSISALCPFHISWQGCSWQPGLGRDSKLEPKLLKSHYCLLSCYRFVLPRTVPIRKAQAGECW